MTIPVTLGNALLNQAITKFSLANGSSLNAANAFATVLNNDPTTVNQLNTAFTQRTLTGFLVGNVPPNALALYTTVNKSIKFSADLVNSLSSALAPSDPGITDRGRDAHY